MEFMTPDGKVDIAFEQLALFFNNNTIVYGADGFKKGMDKAGYKEELLRRGFEDVLADAFIKKYWSMLNGL